MPDFTWKAARADATMVSGSLQAPSQAMAISQLRAQGLTLLKISLAQGEAASVEGRAPLVALSPARSRASALTPSDILVMTSELSIMLQAGLSLDRSFRILADMNAKPAMVTLIEAILADVKNGMPLSRALARYPDNFGDFYVNMIRSGEASGQLSGVLQRLVDHMERLRALRESVISAMTYPAILLAVALLSLLAMLGFVVPQFEALFNGMGDALPVSTRVIMVIAHSFNEYGLLISIGLLALVWVTRRWLRSPSGRVWWQSKVLRFPLLGSLVLKYNLTLYARSLGTLLGNGVPLPAALKIAIETVDNSVLRGALAGILPQVKEGGKMAQAIQASGVFDPLAMNLVKVGEETGRLGHMLLELAHILNRDVEVGIKRSLSLLEPALILLLGLMIATIIVSILLGIISVNDLAI